MKYLIFCSAAALSSAALLALATPVLAAPTISSVTPVSASANNPVILSANIQSAVPIQSCNLYVDLEDVGAMSVTAGMASRSYTFPFGGSRIAFVFCRDTSGGIAAGPNTAIWVTGPLQNEPPLGGGGGTGPTPPPTPPPNNVVRRLVKLACSETADVNDPCRAVYYVGSDGRRHAFPNSRVFFTWYENFDTVQEISLVELAAYQLGPNVTYRPGVRMVKFASLNKVYAIERNGILRWVKTEDVARSLYGADWNEKVDDISDVFYNDYDFGSDIDFANQYNVTAQTEANVTID